MRLGIVSDIHCQFESLAQALEAMGAIDQLICLGDTVSQHQFCNQTITMLRQRNAWVILGNHDEGFLAGPGRKSPRADPQLVGWLEARPARLERVLDGRRVLMVHSTPWPSGHAYVSPQHRDFPRFATSGHEVVLYGHTHQPVVRRLGATLVINPGSVGEGRPSPKGFIRSCAVLDTQTLDARIIDLGD